MTESQWQYSSSGSNWRWA